MIFLKVSDNKSDTILYILSLLSRSNDENNLKIAIDLIVMYLNKKPNKIHEVIYTLVKDFGYELNSYRYGYKKEKIVMDRLWELSKNSDTLLLRRLFIGIASEMLGTDFQDARYHGRTLSLYNYALVLTQALINFRKTIFERLDEIFKNNYFLTDLKMLINIYSRKNNISNSTKIIERDKKYILALATKYFNPKIYKHCKIVRNFLSFLDKNNIIYDKSIQTLFKHSYFGIDDLLCTSPYKNFKGNNIEQNDAYIKNELEKISNNNKTKDRWLELLNICVEIYNVIDDSDKYSFKNNFSMLLEILSSNDSQLFIEVLVEYFKLGDPFSLYLDHRILIKILGKNGAFEFIEKQNFKAKDFWKFGIFAAIDENDITQTDVKNLLDLYKSADIANIPQYFNYLQKYENIKKDIALKILKVLCNRAISNNKFLITIETFFYRFTSMLDEYIKTDKKLMETAYFMRLKDNINFDYNAAILNKFLNYDSDFIHRYIINILNATGNGVSSVDMHTDFSILFNRKDHEEIFLKIIETIHKIPDKKFVFGKGEFLKSFFMGFHSPLLDAQKTINIIKKFIDKYFLDKERMIFISGLLCEFNNDEFENAEIDTRVHLYTYMVSKNSDYELFKSLEFEKNSRTAYGSWVPAIQRDIKFYEKLMSMMNTANLLKHRTFINEMIDDLKSRINREKKFDFMEDERFYRY